MFFNTAKPIELFFNSANLARCAGTQEAADIDLERARSIVRNRLLLADATALTAFGTAVRPVLLDYDSLGQDGVLAEAGMVCSTLRMVSGLALGRRVPRSREAGMHARHACTYACMCVYTCMHVCTRVGASGCGRMSLRSTSDRLPGLSRASDRGRMSLRSTPDCLPCPYSFNTRAVPHGTVRVWARK